MANATSNQVAATSNQVAAAAATLWQSPVLPQARCLLASPEHSAQPEHDAACCTECGNRFAAAALKELP